MTDSLAPDGWPIVQPGLLMAYVGPICFVRIGSALTARGERVHAEELARVIDARPLTARVGVVYDVPDTQGISAIGRSDLARMLNERRERLRRTTAAYALATPSSFVRGMLKAVFWVAPPPYPHAMVSDVDAALAFVAAALPDIDVVATRAAYDALLLAHRGVFGEASLT